MEPAFGSELVGLACPIVLDGQLVLGSGSPRRKELLSLFGLPFEVRTADTAEIAPAGLTDEETVRFVAKEKAEALVPTLQPREVLLTADTEVWMDGERFGKPRDLAHALTMLQRLRGRTHKVITVVWATDGNRWETIRQHDARHHGRTARFLVAMVRGHLPALGQSRGLRRPRMDWPRRHYKNGRRL